MRESSLSLRSIAARRGTLRTALLKSTWAAALTCSLQATALAQQPQWAPSRLPENSTAEPLANARSAAGAATVPTHGQPAEQLGSGVVLRWKSSRSRTDTSAADAQMSRLRQQASVEMTVSTAMVQAAGGSNSNPLRSQVLQAAYQQDGSGALDRFGGNSGTMPPALPQVESVMPSLPGFAAPPAESLPRPGLDPLDSPEMAPTPDALSPGGILPDSGSILDNDARANPFPNQDSDQSPRDNEPELVPPPKGEDRLNPNGARDSDELKRRNPNANSGSCDELRSRLRDIPLTALNLDVSPSYGAGLRSKKKDPEQQRLDFAASAAVRNWSDYRGQALVTGRFIDLRDDRVVIDVGGAERIIPLRDLSDVDVAYVGEAWNIPEKCGTGYEPFDGRNYIASTVQWTASGLCHKPLYFEQVQLERYGHEIGPVLQPLVSSAHFFGSIPILPYKMGIHPPNECQYTLGYYRPGNCAPYMVPPFPISLRGAAVQAGAVIGGAALLP